MVKWLFIVFAIACGHGCGGSRASETASPPVAAGRATPDARPLDLSVRRADGRGGAAATALLSVMESELERSASALDEHGKPSPYFIAYQVTDQHRVTVAASRGALTESGEGRQRYLDLDVRVGSYELDSTRPIRDQGFSFGAYRGSRAWLPIEDNETALRAALWRATDVAYKEAVERFIQVKANTSVKVAAEDDAADFSKEEPVQYYEEPQLLDIDLSAWEPRIKRYSEVLEKYPGENTSSVGLTATVENRFLVTSEGTRVQVSRTYYRLMIWMSTTADDGMELSRYESIELSSLEAMPSEEEIRSKLDAVVDDLLALREAPPAEPYVGPAILEGEAAGVYFHEVFGHRVEGHRQKRVDEGQTFAKKLGKPIMPTFIDVYDDPTIRTLDGIELNGHYQVDDEGVRARRVDLVEKGTLETFLLSRSPTRGFTRSNGHGRRQAGLPVVARQGNLIVHPSSVVSTEALKKRLLAEVERQGKPYGLRFAKVRGGFTTTRRWGPQAFRVMPVMVYRVYPDGREELIRGSNIEGTPLTSLATILAAADDLAVFNGYCGAESGMVPVSAASPSLLIQQVEIAKAPKGQERPAILPPPSRPESEVPR